MGKPLDWLLGNKIASLNIAYIRAWYWWLPVMRRRLVLVKYYGGNLKLKRLWYCNVWWCEMGYERQVLKNLIWKWGSKHGLNCYEACGNMIAFSQQKSTVFSYNIGYQSDTYLKLKSYGIVFFHNIHANYRFVINFGREQSNIVALLWENSYIFGNGEMLWAKGFRDFGSNTSFGSYTTIAFVYYGANGLYPRPSI